MFKILSLILLTSIYSIIGRIINGLPKQPFQKISTLPYITGDPVKLDGGCSYYVNSTIPLRSDSSQLIIDADHRAFIEYRHYKYAFFNRLKRVTNKTGYTDYYKGKTGSFILKIDSIKKDINLKTYRSGTLILTYPKLSQTIKVHGWVQEDDSYYKAIFPHY